MLNNGEIRDFINFLLRKEVSGNRFTTPQFKNLLVVKSLEHFMDRWREYETTQKITESLRRHFVPEEPVALTLGVGNLPASYFKASTFKTTSNFKVDLVTDMERTDRLADALTAPSASYPIVQLLASTLKVNPTTITSILLSYFSKPATPVVDYCNDVDDIWTYMPVGSVIRYEMDTSASLGLEYNLYDADGAIIAEQVSHPTASTFPYTSTSVDLDWDDDDRLVIVDKILQAIGIQLNNTLVTQYTQYREQKDQAK